MAEIFQQSAGNPESGLVFMGTAEFGVPALEQLSASGHTPALVVTAPDKPAGRGQKLCPSPVKLAATRLGLPLLQPASLKDPDFIKALESFHPTIIVVVAFRILPPEVYTLASRGAFNLHASLLPKYRGAAPIQWAIINGDTETGVTTFFLEQSVDTGSIILQKKTPIGENETAGELYERLSALGTETILQTVRSIEAGIVATQFQDNSKATPAPKIFKEDCRIDWATPTRQAHNFIRGVSPRPGAYTYHHETQFKIYRTRVAGDSATATEPGRVTAHNWRMFVSCSDGSLEILEIQHEGRKILPAEEFLRGSRTTIDCFA